MSPIVLAAFLAIQGSQPAPQDEIKDALARAESLYYEAKFNDSVQLLSCVNESLKSQPDRLPEKTSTKLQLALANVGLNNAAAAKAIMLFDFFTVLSAWFYFLISPQLTMSFPPYGLEMVVDVCTQSLLSIGQ